MSYEIPKVGQEIYVRSACSIGHGETDVVGGLATISRVEFHPEQTINQYFVTVKELPGHGYNYDVLMEEQDELKAEFGTNRAYPDPDFHDYGPDDYQ